MRELAATQKGAEFTCNSASMEPTIRVGESVRVHAVPLAWMRIGDLVVYEGADDIYMLHRIIFIAPGRRWFLHIGDAPTPAGPRRAPMHAIVGRVESMREPPHPRVYWQALRNGLRAIGKRCAP